MEMLYLCSRAHTHQIHGWRCVPRTMIMIMIARMHVCAIMCVCMFVSMYVLMHVCRCVCTSGASVLWVLPGLSRPLGVFFPWAVLWISGVRWMSANFPTSSPSCAAVSHICHGEVVFRMLFLFSLFNFAVHNDR